MRSKKKSKSGKRKTGKAVKRLWIDLCMKRECYRKALDDGPFCAKHSSHAARLDRLLAEMWKADPQWHVFHRRACVCVKCEAGRRLYKMLNPSPIAKRVRSRRGVYTC